MRFPLASLLEGPQRTPPQSPVEITVERVPWDVIAVDLGPEPGGGPDGGVVAPGARLPVTVAFHVLTPEPTEVAVRCVAELRPARGGERVWWHELKPTVPTNTATPPTFVLPIDAPKEEGTYVLELRATWEAAAAHDSGKLLNRLIRRGKRGLFRTATSSRRVTLAVLGPAEPGSPRPGREAEVDAVDLGRLRGHRAWGSGRSPRASGSGWVVPEEALAEATPRERLRGLIGRAGAEVAVLGPADGNGLAWSSVGLRAAHPGRPHRLTVTVHGGHPAALGVALVGPAAGPAAAAGPVHGARHRLLLDARASGPPVPPEGPPATFSWPVWPDSADPVLVLVNRSPGAPARVGAVALTELPDLPAGPAVEPPPGGAPARGLGLALGGPEGFDRFGGSIDAGLTDALAAARNLGAYVASCGATAAVLPEGLADRSRRRALDGTAAEDATGPDRLELALRVLARRKVAGWVALGLDGPLPGLPAAGAPEALARGLVRVDRRGQADGPAPAYHPLADEVAAALRRRVGAAAAPGGRAPRAGVLVRLGPGATLLGGPDTGFDDATFARFVAEAFDPETARGVPGRSADDPDRFAARARFVAGPGRMPWLAWRSKRVAALYADLAAAAREAAPGAALAVATPGPDDGPAGAEAHRADLAGLAPNLAWRAVGLDLDAWPAGDAAPIVLRGVGLGPDDLAHDLATSPELDARVAARAARGLFVDADAGPGPGAPAPAGGSGLCLKALVLDGGPDGDEPLGHALAALDAHHVWLAAGAIAGQEERLRRFARVFRALPATPPAERRPLAFGVAVRAHPAGGHTFLALANDTPYPVRLDAALTGPAGGPLFDLGRGVALKPAADAAGRHLVLDLPPFGVAAVRDEAAAVGVASVTPYPSEAVLATLKSRHDAVAEQLTRLNRGGDRDKGRSGPPNPGFEPEAPRETALRLPPMPGAEPPPPPPAPTDPMATPAAVAPAGWQVAGGMGDALMIDPAAPHSGRGALRLDAPNPPAAAVSDGFTPAVHSVLLVRAWLRSDRPDARVKVWIEGESNGQPYRRVSELAVAPGWTERAVRAGDLPPGGLDSVRLRFELLTPGSLWVDDLAVSGETLSEPERRNARNALLAALQAYREKRFADFARLSGSHWARHPGAAPAGGTPERVASERSGLLRSGDASPLPPVRRLR